MGWLRLVGCLKIQVSFAKEPYKRDHYSAKRHVFLSILLIVATPYQKEIYCPFVNIKRHASIPKLHQKSQTREPYTLSKETYQRTLYFIKRDVLKSPTLHQKRPTKDPYTPSKKMYKRAVYSIERDILKSTILHQKSYTKKPPIFYSQRAHLL